MPIKRLLLILAAGAAGYYLVSRYRQGGFSADTGAANAPSPYKPMIEEVLHQHQGEETPIVQAFEAALEEERRHEEQLAHDAGVRG